MNIDLAISSLYFLQVSFTKRKWKVGELLDLLGKTVVWHAQKIFFFSLIPLNLDLQLK